MTAPPSGVPAAKRPPSGTSRRIARARAGAADLSERLDPTVVGRLWPKLLEMEFVDRSVALAAKAFVSFFPLLILVTALSPATVRAGVLENLGRRFGLSGEAFAVVKNAFASPDQTRSATGVIGAIVTVAFAVSFTTALQRTYLRAWRRPPGGGARNKGRGALWVGGIVALMLVLALVRSLLAGSGGTVLSWGVGVVLATGLWWWTARLMTRGEIRWRPLLPTAILTGIGSWLYTMAASVWMPTSMTKNFAQFGAFGIALAFVSWFTGLAFLVVLSAALAPALSDGDGRTAHWLRGGRPTALEPGAAPPLPGPDRPMRLSDAFGRGGQGSGVRPSPPARED